MCSLTLVPEGNLIKFTYGEVIRYYEFIMLLMFSLLIFILGKEREKCYREELFK